MSKQKIRIRLKAFDYKLIDQALAGFGVLVAPINEAGNSLNGHYTD